jgi:probable rRNA maturation factor
MPKKINSSTVQFHFLTAGFVLKDRNKLKAYLIALFKKEHVELSHLNYIFCSDKYLLQINKDFLQHNYYTDIITFDLSEKGQAKIADIYISIDRVRDNCKILGEPFKKELHRVIIHGVLHLCGYKDNGKTEKLAMRKKEDSCLFKYFG